MVATSRSGEQVRWRDASARGPYIRCSPSGQPFFLADPTPDQFRPRDIARHLAGVNRYTGASRYSVAQHCVVASRIAGLYYTWAGRDIARMMLVHDVAEAFYGDMSSPLKHLCPDYRAMEKKADAAVEAAFGVQFVGNPVVKEIDDRMWLTESRLLFGAPATEDYRGPLQEFPESLWSAPDDFVPWGPERAEVAWLSAFRTQFPGMVDK